MKRSGELFATGVASILAAFCPDAVRAAEGKLAAQDLTNVEASGQVTARWIREPESYTLLVVMERSKPRPVAIRSANAKQPPAPAQQHDRPGYFIGNVTANLRDLDPLFSCIRSLTLADGRRTAQNIPGRAPPILPYDPKARQPRVDAWLLKADGMQIPAADYTCTSHPGSTEVRYEYPAADGGQAVAAAIRIDDEYYIEKLQPLEPGTAP